MTQTRIDDLKVALIFLREGLTRTKNLQSMVAAGRAASPDIPCRIETLEGAIRRFENEVADYRADIIAKEKELEESQRTEWRAAKKGGTRKMNKKRKEALDEILEKIEALREEVETYFEEEEEYRDNIPENLQESERYQNAEEAAENLDSALTALTDATDYLLAAIGEG